MMYLHACSSILQSLPFNFIRKIRIFLIWLMSLILPQIALILGLSRDGVHHLEAFSLASPFLAPCPGFPLVKQSFHLHMPPTIMDNDGKEALVCSIMSHIDARKWMAIFLTDLLLTGSSNNALVASSEPSGQGSAPLLNTIITLCSHSCSIHFGTDSPSAGCS